MLESLAELIVYGQPGFWVLFVLINLLVLWMAELGRGWAAALSLAGFAAALQLACNVPVLTWFKAHPFDLILWGVGFLAVGVLNVYWKWWLKVGHDYRAVRRHWLEFCVQRQLGAAANNETAITDENREAFLRHLEDAARYGEFEIRPLFREHFAEAYVWLVFWPWVSLWTLLDDPLRRLAISILNVIASSLQRIANRNFSKVSAYLPKKIKDKQ